MNKILYLIILITLYSSVSYSQENEYASVKTYCNKERYSDKDTIKIAVELSIKSKYHINSFYTDDPSLIKTELIYNGDKNFKLAGLFYPEDKLYKFEFSENKIRVYEGTVLIGSMFIPETSVTNGEYKIIQNLTYQACDDKMCYAPRSINIETPVKINKDGLSSDYINRDIFSKIDFNKPAHSEIIKGETKISENPRSETPASDEEQVSRFIEERGILLGIILIFLGGLALNLTPCIYPLIPITISYFGAQVSGNKFQSIMMGVFYALGMAVTYSSLGLFAALTGSLLGTALQNPFVIIAVALVLFVLSLSMFGLYEIKIPQKLAMAGGKSRTGYFGSLLMGLLVGFIAAPCIGPFVLSLLVYVGKIGNPLTGFLLFFVLSMGLGLPYVFLAASSSSLSKLPRSGEWMEGVKIIFGFILIIMGINTLAPVIPKNIYAILFPLFIILSGCYLLLIDKKGLTSKVFTKIKFIIAILAIIYGSWNLKPESVKESVEWKMLNSIQQITESIKTEKKPVLIDFYADWCAQCKELDEFTYTDKDIIELTKSTNNIKIDLTKENTGITDKFGIKGLPVVIFMNSSGEEIKELRVTGFLNPKEFGKKLEILLNSGN